MLSRFFPADRLDSYRTSAYKDRIDRIGQRLVEQRYRPEVTAQHLREWLRVTRYLQARKLRLPLALDAPEVARYVTDRVVGLGASRTRFVRAAVRIFLDADDHGCWRRRIGRAPEPVPVWLGSVLDEYTMFLRGHRGLAPRTVSLRVWQLTRFATYLDQDGVTRLAAIAPRHVRDFLIKLRTQASGTRVTYVSTLRGFFRWAVMAGLLPRDLSAAVVPPRHFRQRGLRDALSEREVTRLLNGVDRSSVIGRRDYAVLLLAGPVRPASLRPPAAPPRRRRLAGGRAVDHPGQDRPRPHPAAAPRGR